LQLSLATFETENIFKSPYNSRYVQDFLEVPKRNPSKGDWFSLPITQRVTKKMAKT
jgi:hypothetical protein